MNEYVVPGTELDATHITSITLVGYNTDKYPVKGGNCFSLMTDKNEEYRIVNFGYENLKEVIRRGINWPIKIKVLDGKVAVIADERIPDRWYNDRFCEVCTPTLMLPIIQKLAIERQVKCGAISYIQHANGMVIVKHSTEKEPKLAPPEYKQVRLGDLKTGAECYVYDSDIDEENVATVLDADIITHPKWHWNVSIFYGKDYMVWVKK